jgi:hypothetical protein
MSRQRRDGISLLCWSVIFVLTFVMVACSPLEQQARNTAAALNGAISAAQTQFMSECTASPKDQPCVIINQAVAGQNALVTAVEAYCGWSETSPPANGAETCVPVKGAAAGLQTAINNATLFITELKGIVK